MFQGIIMFRTVSVFQGELSEEDEAKEEDLKSTTVPRREGFWDHDNRFTDIPVEEERKPREGNRGKLWDKTEVDRWNHDCYVESEQGMISG